jgi:alpha-L-fucosidase
MTMTKCKEGGGWSYRPDGKTISYREVIQTLVQTVTGDGNLLLNVGPLPTGEFPADQVAILKKMGKWLSKNGESIYGTRGGPIPNGEWGGMTFKDNKIYVHILNWPKDGSNLVLSAIDKKIVRSKGLNVKNQVVKQTKEGVEIDLPVKNRNEIDSIIELEIE